MIKITTQVSIILEGVEKEKREFVPYKQILQISEWLLSSNDEEVLAYHFSLLKCNIDATFYHHLFEDFEKRPLSVIEPFLLKKIYDECDVFLKGVAIQLLGSVGSNKILPYLRAHIDSEDDTIRDCCIIVLGWVGDKNDLLLLNERLQNDTNAELRGNAATAMREIWFAERALAEDILPYLYQALLNETAEETLLSIIIVIQDLLQRKFGLQERSNEGSITGDPLKAKVKIMKTRHFLYWQQKK